MATLNVFRNFATDHERPDLPAFVSSGLCSECLAATAAFGSRGVEGLSDTQHGAIFGALTCLRAAALEPGCTAQIRNLDVAEGLALALEHDLEWVPELGLSTSTGAAQICAAVFGRDEEGSEFRFTQAHVDMLCVRHHRETRHLLT